LVEAPDDADAAAGFESDEDDDELDEDPESDDDFEPDSEDFEPESVEVDAAEVDEPLDFAVERESVR
jgi:hypothetical protein